MSGIRVCYIDTSGYSAIQLARDCALLDDTEHAAHDRHVIAEDRRDYAAAHALLRSMLSAALPDVEPHDWRFARRGLGKPFVAGPHAQALSFSLSHCRGLVACAIGPGDAFGIDVECGLRHGDVTEVMAEVCSSDEQEQISRVAPTRRTDLFLDLWTLKEAYLKARGFGVTVPLQRVCFDLREPNRIVALPKVRMRDWRFHLYRLTATGRLAVAFRHDAATEPAMAVTAHGCPHGLGPVRSSYAKSHG